jgi:hypothetical protein
VIIINIPDDLIKDELEHVSVRRKEFAEQIEVESNEVCLLIYASMAGVTEKQLMSSSTH